MSPQQNNIFFHPDSKPYVRKRLQKENLHSKNLSRSLEGGTETSAVVAWNTCVVFITSTLGVSTFQYAPYATLNDTVPVIGIILSILGVKVEYLTKQEKEE